MGNAYQNTDHFIDGSEAKIIQKQAKRAKCISGIHI